VGVAVGEQQIPHRRFAPIRNDKGGSDELTVLPSTMALWGQSVPGSRRFGDALAEACGLWLYARDPSLRLKNRLRSG